MRYIVTFSLSILLFTIPSFGQLVHNSSFEFGSPAPQEVSEADLLDNWECGTIYHSVDWYLFGDPIQYLTITESMNYCLHTPNVIVAI
jgi:hypothetical protein